MRALRPADGRFAAYTVRTPLIWASCCTPPLTLEELCQALCTKNRLLLTAPQFRGGHRTCPTSAVHQDTAEHTKLRVALSSGLKIQPEESKLGINLIAPYAFSHVTHTSPWPLSRQLFRLSSMSKPRSPRPRLRPSTPTSSGRGEAKNAATGEAPTRASRSARTSSAYRPCSTSRPAERPSTRLTTAWPWAYRRRGARSCRPPTST